MLSDVIEQSRGIQRIPHVCLYKCLCTCVRACIGACVHVCVCMGTLLRSQWPYKGQEECHQSGGKAFQVEEQLGQRQTHWVARVMVGWCRGEEGRSWAGGRYTAEDGAHAKDSEQSRCRWTLTSGGSLGSQRSEQECGDGKTRRESRWVTKTCTRVEAQPLSRASDPLSRR